MLYALRSLPGDTKKTALKLHRQFAHPGADKLIKLLRDAGYVNKLLENEIRSLSSSCEVCMRYKRKPSTPVVSMPLARSFNDVIAMDLKCYEKVYFLVIVDLFTRYCSAMVIPNKMSATVISGIFRCWITFFGSPKKILSDNGREFNSEEFQTFAEAFNIKLLNTAAESPWSNGVCEKMNDTLGRSVYKIMEDTKCGIDTALAWAVSARNSLTNFSGFSPNQLVFGYNPALPSNFENTPPALEEVVSSEIVRANLAAMNAARQEFVRIEADEKIRRALSSNVRMSNMGTIQEGDEVFYKRGDDIRWHGPAVVTAVHGKQLMVRHGGNFHRVHICRLARYQQETGDNAGEKLDKGSKIDTGTQTGEKIYNCVQCNKSFGQEKDFKDHICVNTEMEEPDDVGEDSNSVEDDVMDQHEVHEEDQAIDIPTNTSAEEGQQDNSESQPLRAWKKGERFQGRNEDTGEIIVGKIMGRAGKATGVNKHCYNIERDDGWTGWYNLSTLSEIQEITDETEMLVLYNKEEVSEAKEKEIENWRKNDVYEEIANEGQRLMSTRWVVTEKVKEGKVITKARLVARGFEENTTELRRDSPTCSRESVRILLSVAASKQWLCHVVDVKAAYLQGNAIEREVFLKPPPEYDDGMIWRLKKTVYGLCDAARAWYLRVKDELEKLKVKKCSLDNSLFMWYENGVLEGLICIYVDDFLWVGSDAFKNTIIEQLKEKFLIGSSGSAAFKYIGLNIDSRENCIYVDQGQYINSLEPIKISRGRSRQRDSLLLDEEKTAFRTLVGQLNWITTNTRPDIAYDVCDLSTSCKTATVGDLLRMNKVIKHVKEDIMMLRFPRINNLEKCTIEVFSDASFGNLKGDGSQGAIIAFLKDERGERCPLYWHTRKLRRVVKSTLAAETMALLEGAETGLYLGKILEEVLGLKIITVSCITDNKSLVESLYSTKKVEDKRLRIDMAVLVQMMERKEIDSVQWVDTKGQLADCMTKRGVSSEKLRAVLAKN